MRLLNLMKSGISFPIAFANSNAGAKVFISEDPMPIGSLLAAFTAMTWLEIKAVGSHGEGGANTNILNYDSWDTDVIQKAKGMTDAGSPEIEVARISNDPGQMAARAAAATNLNWGFKMQRNDPLTLGGTPTLLYNLGLITGPKRPFGRNEDFDLEIFALALNQREIVVDPT